MRFAIAAGRPLPRSGFVQASSATLSAETQLAIDDRRSQRAFGRVVGWFDSLDASEGPEMLSTRV